MSTDARMDLEYVAALACIGGVETVERAARSRMVQGQTVHLDRNMGQAYREVLMALGFEFLPEPADPDPLLVPVAMPPGWSIKRTDHYMYSHLCDPEGRVRGQVGYKASPHDRWACLVLYRRYTVEQDYSTSKTLPDGTPQAVADLQSTRQEAIVEEVPDDLPYGYGYVVDPMWVFEAIVEHQGKGRQRTFTRVARKFRTVPVNLFDPYRKHQNLPYIRFYIKDRAMDQRIWTGRWLSYAEVKKIDAGTKVKGADTSQTAHQWLLAKFPQADDLLAYWNV